MVVRVALLELTLFIVKIPFLEPPMLPADFDPEQSEQAFELAPLEREELSPS